MKEVRKNEREREGGIKKYIRISLEEVRKEKGNDREDKKFFN
jgi:hypothetical protein